MLIWPNKLNKSVVSDAKLAKILGLLPQPALSISALI